MTAGSIDPSMEAVMGVEGLSMFKGAPAHGEYPASPSHIEMEMPSGEHMEMEAVTIRTTAATDDSNNYHFMPHVAWVEPGQMVFWEHFGAPGVSEKRTHTVTSFGASGQFMRLIPEGVSHFDSGFRAGTHGEGYLIDERFNRKMVRLLGTEGGFGIKFQEPGVYLYYCQNHHMFKMAGAVVVTELWGEHGDQSVSNPKGWAPAMTTEPHKVKEADPLHGEPLSHQIEELHTMITSGGESMGHGMEMGGGDDGEDHSEEEGEHSEEEEEHEG